MTSPISGPSPLVEMKGPSSSSTSSPSSSAQELTIIPGTSVIKAPNGTLISVNMTEVYEYTTTRRGYLEDSNGDINYPTSIPSPGSKAKYVPGWCDRMDRSPIIITRDAPFDPSDSMFDSWRACTGIKYENFGFKSMIWERAPDHRPLRDRDDDPQMYTDIQVWVDPQDTLSISRIEGDNELRRREIAQARAEMQRLASRTIGQKILDECIIM